MQIKERHRDEQREILREIEMLEKIIEDRYLRLSRISDSIAKDLNKEYDSYLGKQVRLELKEDAQADSKTGIFGGFRSRMPKGRGRYKLVYPILLKSKKGGGLGKNEIWLYLPKAIDSVKTIELVDSSIKNNKNLK